MIDKAIQIRPGMRVRHVESRTEKTIISAGGDGRDVITNFGGWLGGEAAFRARHELVDPPATPELARQQERRLRDGWKGDAPYGWLCTGVRCRGTFTLAKYHRGPGRVDGACSACAESMGVYEPLAAAETNVGNQAPVGDGADRPGLARRKAATPAAAPYSTCPCARMNLRDLSGDPVCYCTERPNPARVVGKYAPGEGPGKFGRVPIAEFDGYCAWSGEQTGVATGLAMEARPKSATEVACERAGRWYGSTCDDEPSGA